MRIRATLLAALVVMFGASSGMAADPGGRYKMIGFMFPSRDSSNLVMGDETGVSTINDTTLYYSRVFGYEGPFTNLIVNLVRTSWDTSTATGLCADTIGLALETRLSNDSADWHVVATSTAAPLGTWSEALATNVLNLVMADSITSVGEEFRVKIIHIAEEDSLQSHVTLKSSSVVKVLDEFMIHARFWLR